jgi:hypothetical protein
MAAITEMKQNVRDCKNSNIVRKEQGYQLLMCCTMFVIFRGNKLMLICRIVTVDSFCMSVFL